MVSDIKYVDNMLVNVIETLKELRTVIPQLETTVVYKENTCLDCTNWNHKEDKCKKYNVKPPATVIVRASALCPEGFDFDVPF